MRARGPSGAFIAALLASSSLAGCLAAEVEPTLTASPQSGAQRPVVVALLDTGVNVYHDVFQADGDPGAAVTAERTPVTLARGGDYMDRIAADEAFWGSVETGRLYSFHGTRLLGVTFVPAEQRPGGVFQALPRGTLLDTHGHGTATASVVAQVDPRAVIVFVQVDVVACFNTPQTDCFLSPTFAEAMAWVAKQPWIDVVSVSANVPGRLPDSSVHPESKAFLEATRLAAARGKLVVNSAGNDPSATLTDYLAGPPHVIAVGGAEYDERGRTVRAGTGVDVVANYTARIALAGSASEYGADFGTSFSAPVVAGVLSAGLAAARERLSDPIDAARARAALNRTAILWGPSDYRVNTTGLGVLGALQAAPVLAPGEVGWGFVDASLTGALADALVAGEVEPGSAKREVALAQDAYQAARVAYWGDR